jgi:hypothetical protein
MCLNINLSVNKQRGYINEMKRAINYEMRINTQFNTQFQLAYSSFPSQCVWSYSSCSARWFVWLQILSLNFTEDINSCVPNTRAKSPVFVLLHISFEVCTSRCTQVLRGRKSPLIFLKLLWNKVDRSCRPVKNHVRVATYTHMVAMYRINTGALWGHL